MGIACAICLFLGDSWGWSSQAINLMVELCIAEATQAFSSKTTKMLRPTVVGSVKNSKNRAKDKISVENENEH